MSLREEIEANYTDATGLVCNRPCLKTDVNPSGNGVCYTGEYLAILASRGEQLVPFGGAVHRCFVQLGLLSRGPGQPDVEGPDDYYGLMAGCQAFRASNLARYCLDWGYSHWGSFNNVEPTKWTWQSFLWRQPQLLYAMLVASRRDRWYHLLLVLYTATVIGMSGLLSSSQYSTDRTNWDMWRLNWLLIQTVSPRSWLCRQAAKLWWRRLRKVWPKGMRDVYIGYLGSEHPFSRWAVNDWEAS